MVGVVGAVLTPILRVTKRLSELVLRRRESELVLRRREFVSRRTAPPASMQWSDGTGVTVPENCGLRSGIGRNSLRHTDTCDMFIGV